MGTDAAETNTSSSQTMGRHPPTIDKHPRRRTPRRGAAAVEFAVTVPLLFLFFFTALEFGRLHMVRHTMQNAAYEAARVGLRTNVSEDEIEQAASALLAIGSVRKAEVDVVQGREDVTVTISAAWRNQGWFAPLYFRNGRLSSTMTLVKDVAE